MTWQKLMHKLFGCAYVWVGTVAGSRYELARAKELNGEWWAKVSRRSWIRLDDAAWRPAMGGPEKKTEDSDDTPGSA